MHRIEWSYVSELPEQPGAFEYGDEAHCAFLIRFTDVPIGPGHCAFFCVNVVASATAVGTARRGYLVADGMTAEALRYRITADEEAFAGVGRDNGVTLREALALDDYASAEEQAAARALDVDTDWHNVPLDVLSARCEFFSYLDAAGLRYYLPAAMLFSLNAENRARSDTPERTYWALLPVVAPRHRGKGLNDAFDCEAFIARCSFTDAQVRALYRFACFMATEGGEGVDEEQLVPMRRWRESAGRR